MAGHSHICHKLRFIGIDTPGAMQGLWTLPAHTLHRLPESLPLKQGALVEPIAVACHDVRLSNLQPGEFALVFGGGPVGAVIALVAKSAGARVVVAELNPFRIALLGSFGIEAVNPGEVDLAAFVEAQTNGAGADVMFEVSGSKAAAKTMRSLARTRGRIVMVAIHSAPVEVDLFRFFWRELVMLGARVYEPCDLDAAIALAGSGALPLDQIITDVYPIDDLAAGFRELEEGGRVMKIVVACS